MSPKTSQSTTPNLSSTAPVAPKNQNPREQEFSVIVKELKNGMVAGFVRRINVGGRWADNPAEVALKTEVGNALAAMRKNCGSDEQFARLVQEMVDILVNADKETLQIRTDAQKKLSELKEQCAREGSGRGQGGGQESISIGKQMMEYGRDHTRGDMRLGLKSKLEEIGDKNSKLLESTYQELVTDPKKLSIFMRGWEIGWDENWKAHVLKTSPKSHAILKSWYDWFQKSLGITMVWSDKLFEEKYSAMRNGQTLSLKITQIRASLRENIKGLQEEKAVLRGVFGDKYRDAILAQESEVNRLSTIATGIGSNVEIQKCRDLLAAIDSIKKLELRSIDKTQKESADSKGWILDSAFAKARAMGWAVLNAADSKFYEGADKNIEAALQSLNGNTSANVGKKNTEWVVINTIETVETLVLKIRNREVKDINSAEFTTLIQLLEREGLLNLETLVTRLGFKTVQSIAEVWWNNPNTEAQKALAKTHPRALWKISKELQGLRDSLKMEPGVDYSFTKELLTKELGSPARAEQVIEFLKRSGTVPTQFIKGLAVATGRELEMAPLKPTDFAQTSIAFVQRIAEAIERDKSGLAVKVSLGSSTLLKYKHQRVLDFTKDINPSKVSSLVNIQKDALNATHTFEELSGKIEVRDQLFQAFSILEKNGWLSKEQIDFVKDLRKYLGLREGASQAGAMKDKMIATETVKKVQKVKAVLEAEKKRLWVEYMSPEMVDAAIAKDVPLSQELKAFDQIVIKKAIEQEQDNLNTDYAAEARKIYPASHFSDTMTNGAGDTRLAHYTEGDVPSYFGYSGGSSAPSVSDARRSFRESENAYGSSSSNLQPSHTEFSNSSGVSYSSLQSQATPFAASGDIYGALSSNDAPLNLGNCIIAQDTSGRVTIATPSERFTVEAKEAPAILALTRISGQLNMPFLISSIPLLKPLLKRDDATRDGFSPREESELTARIAAMLGFSDLNPTDSSTQIMRHMENQRDPRYSYEWLAQKNGLISNNGRPIESTLVAAFKNASSITAANAANAKNQVSEIPNFQTA